MTTHIRRWALLFVALALLAAFALAACGQPGGASLYNANYARAAVLSTPGAGSGPMPTFPPFTIGAWPSNSMPAAGKSVIIYVTCQIQDPTMARPSQPAVGQTVHVRLLDPVNQTYTGTTDAGGIAAVRVAYNHARARTPILIVVTSTWKGTTYQGQTTFTPASSTGAPVDETPQPGATPSAPPLATVTPAPQPQPTATPAPAPPTPTPTPVPPPPKPTPTPTPAPPPPPTPTAAP
jgi:hypothetical protein